MLQASLTQRSLHVLAGRSPVELLVTWEGNACGFTAEVGMLLVQSAFEVAPLPASYPVVVTTELVAGVVLGVLLLGGTFALGTGAVIGTAG